MHKIKSQKLKVKTTSQNLKFWVLNCGFTFCVLTFTFTCFAQDKIVAIVNSDIITQKDVTDFLNFMRIQLSRDYSGKELLDKIETMKLDVLDRLIEDRLILQEAKRNNVRAYEENVKAKLNEIRKNYATDADFTEALSKQGLVLADVESKIRDQLLMYNIVDGKVRRRVVINPGDVTDYYQNNSDSFRLPEQREFESIKVADESAAREIAGKLKQGQQPKDMAKEYSAAISRMSASQDGQLRKGIETVVFSLKPNEISHPVKIENDYYVFKLESIIPPRQESLSEAQENIYGLLSEKKMGEEMAKWLDELKKQSYIKIIQE